MPKKFLKNDICHNCKTNIGDYNYCPNCGQINSHKQIHLRQILKDLLGDYFTFDSKFFKSLWPLLRKPGHLTTEYISGKRNSYILPLRLYIFTTFLFFFVFSLSSTIDPYKIEESKRKQVTQDSLRQFFKAYDDDLSLYLRETLIMDLGDKYKLEKKDNRTENRTEQDSIKKYLLESKPILADSLAGIYAKQITGKFSFVNIKEIERVQEKVKKKLEDSYIPGSAIKTAQLNSMQVEPENRLVIKKMLLQYQFSVQEIDVFFSKVDTVYFYDKRKWKTKSINVTFSGQDTTNISFLRELEKKAEYIFAQGSKGWGIFWNELIRQIPKIMFLLLPLFALLLKLFYIRQRIFYINHLIFALHVHSLFFMYLIIAILWPSGWIIGGSIVAIWLHTFMAFKNVYHQKSFLTFFKLNSILFLYFFVNIFAFILLSMIAVWSA